MRLLYVAITLSFVGAVAQADTITLKSGRVISGTYLGSNARTIRVDRGDRVETLDVSDVARIEFSGPGASMDDRPPVLRRQDSDSDSDRPRLRRAPGSDSDAAPASGGILRPDSAPDNPPPPPVGSIEVPAGSTFVIRLIDSVDSEKSQVGQTFAATLDEPVRSAGGDTLIPRGADVVVKLVDSKESGKLTGRAEVALSLASVKVYGRSVDVNTTTVTQVSDSRGQRTAKVAGGTAVVGAVIGAIAGGGKGAAVGAAAGGAAGAGAEALTKGQVVKIPSETRLTFVLDNPIKI